MGSTSAHPGTPAHVLIADDDAINRRVLGEHLERFGCRVTAIDDGESVLEALAKDPCELVFMDLELPNLDGLSLARIIRSREQGVHMPIIALTAEVATHIRKSCIDVGMDDVLVKPLTAEQLHGVLERYVPRVAGPRPGAQQRPAAPDGVLDLSLLQDAFGDDRAVIASFLSDESLPVLRELQTNLEEALDRLDDAECLWIAHRMRGAAATIGATSMSHALATLDLQIKVSDWDNAAGSLQAVKDALDGLDAWLAASRSVG